jgi:hypothetical protein
LPSGGEIDLTVVLPEDENLTAVPGRLDYVFYYNSSSAIVNATVLWHSSDVDTDNTSVSDVECQISVTFISADATLPLPKSGSQGYAFQQPVIAGYMDNGTLVVQSDLAGSFPIPFGYECEDVRYTPLLFGVETVAGCSRTDPALNETENIDLSMYNHVAIHGVANPNNTLDWILVNDDQCSPEHPHLFQRYIFYYEKFGEVKNAQHRITSVVYQCSGVAQPGGPRIITASFLQVANKDPRPFVPPNPRLPGIPRDTWYPFGSSAGVFTKSPSAALVWGVMFVSAVLFAM